MSRCSLLCAVMTAVITMAVVANVGGILLMLLPLTRHNEPVTIIEMGFLDGFGRVDLKMKARIRHEV